MTILAASGCGLFGPEPSVDGEWHGQARVAHGVDRWTLNLVESGGTLTGSYTVVTAVVDPDPVSYSGAVTGSFTAASVFQHPAFGDGPVHPAWLRLDARVDFGGGIEGSCRYDARVSDDLDAMDGNIRCQVYGPEWVTRSGALSMGRIAPLSTKEFDGDWAAIRPIPP